MNWIKRLICGCDGGVVERERSLPEGEDIYYYENCKNLPEKAFNLLAEQRHTDETRAKNEFIKRFRCVPKLKFITDGCYTTQVDALEMNIIVLANCVCIHRKDYPSPLGLLEINNLVDLAKEIEYIREMKKNERNKVIK